MVISLLYLSEIVSYILENRVDRLLFIWLNAINILPLPLVGLQIQLTNFFDSLYGCFVLHLQQATKFES